MSTVTRAHDDMLAREAAVREREERLIAKEALFERNAHDLQEAIRDVFGVSPPQSLHRPCASLYTFTPPFSPRSRHSLSPSRFAD